MKSRLANKVDTGDEIVHPDNCVLCNLDDDDDI